MKNFADQMSSACGNDPLKNCLLVTTLAIGACYLTVNVILPVAVVALSIMMSMAPYALAFYLFARCAGLNLFSADSQPETSSFSQV